VPDVPSNADYGRRNSRLVNSALSWHTKSHRHGSRRRCERRRGCDLLNRAEVKQLIAKWSTRMLPGRNIGQTRRRTISSTNSTRRNSSRLLARTRHGGRSGCEEQERAWTATLGIVELTLIASVGYIINDTADVGEELFRPRPFRSDRRFCTRGRKDDPFRGSRNQWSPALIISRRPNPGAIFSFSSSASRWDRSRRTPFDAINRPASHEVNV
jgi:hypothetical protein